MAIFGLPFLTPPKPTTHPSPNSTPIPPKSVNYEEEGINLLAKSIKDGVEFFDTVAKNATKNNKNLDEYFQNSLNWLTGKKQDPSLSKNDTEASTLTGSCGSISPRSTSSTLTETTVDKTNQDKAIEFKNFLKDLINAYIKTLGLFTQYLFKDSILVRNINDVNDTSITATVAKFRYS